VITRLIAGTCRVGGPAILVIFGAGYDVTRLAWLPCLSAVLPGRLRGGRVMHLPGLSRPPGTMGRPRAPRQGLF
jgi:hypothetical protein